MPKGTRAKSAPKRKNQRRRRSVPENAPPVHSYFKPLPVVPAPEPKPHPSECVPTLEKNTDDGLSGAIPPHSDAEPEEVQEPEKIPSTRTRRRSRRSLLAKKSTVPEESSDSLSSKSKKSSSSSSSPKRPMSRRSARNIIYTPPGDPALPDGDLPYNDCVILSSAPPSPNDVVSVPPNPPPIPRIRLRLPTGFNLARMQTSLSHVSPFSGVSIKPRRRGRSSDCCSKCGAPAYSITAKRPDSPVSPDLKDSPESVDSDSSLEQTEPVASSRLSRKGQRARRATQRNSDSKRKRAPEIVDLIVDADQPMVVNERAASPKRRRKLKTSEASIVSKPATAPSQKLHSFFAATQKAVASAKTDTGNRKAAAVAAHPWSSAYATVHINAPCFDIVALPVAPKPSTITLPDFLSTSELFSYHDYENSTESRKAEKLPRVPKLTKEARVSVWSELYKDCEKIDQVNSTATASLVDWLRLWYGVKISSSSSGCESSSEDSMCSDLDDGRFHGADRIALVTGPSGSGKSTVIKVAARQLGLSVLEINQSMCRSGKRVKDIVGEAMKSHRVTGRQKSFSFGKRSGQCTDLSASEKENYSPRTLIVFEEVDELHEDEHGFWRMVRELVSAEDCMRPIVCTANKFNSTMQSIFGGRLPSDELTCVHRLLLPDPVEEQTNTLGFKHIELQARSPRQVSSVLKAVAKREKLGLDKHALELFSQHARPGDIRSAINSLQYCGTLSRPSNFVSLVNSAAHIVCSGRSCKETSLALSNCETWLDNDSVLEGIYRGMASHLTTLSNSPTESKETIVVDDSLAVLADTMETFVEADIIGSAVLSDSLDVEMLIEEELIPDAHLLNLRSSSITLAADIRAQALISLMGTVEVDQMESDLIAQVATHEISTLGHPMKTPIDLYGPTLGRRAAAADTLPYLRVMAVACRAARDRVAIEGQPEPATKAATISRLGRWTRSRTRGNHMHSLGLNEDASASLEHSCLVKKRLRAKLNDAK